MLLSPVGTAAQVRPAPPAFAHTSGKDAVRGRGLTKACVRIRDGLARVPVEEGSAAVTVLALRVVLAALAHAPADSAAGQVRGHVEVTALRVAVTVTSWERRGVTEIHRGPRKARAPRPRTKPASPPPLSSATPPSFYRHTTYTNS